MEKTIYNQQHFNQGFQLNSSFQQLLKNDNREKNSVEEKTYFSNVKNKNQLLKDVKCCSKQRRFKCHYCNYSTTTSSMLKKHIRVHTGEKPYKCNVCHFAARCASSLTVHKRIHTGEYPYKCPFCNYAANRSTHLKRHIKNNHQKKKSLSHKINNKSSLVENFTGKSGFYNDAPLNTSCHNLQNYSSHRNTQNMVGNGKKDTIAADRSTRKKDEFNFTVDECKESGDIDIVTNTNVEQGSQCKVEDVSCFKIDIENKKYLLEVINWDN